MIKVTVQREDRLKAISDLASAVKSLAEALNSSPHIDINHCTISGVGENSYAIKIDTVEEVNETMITKEEE